MRVRIWVKQFLRVPFNFVGDFHQRRRKREERESGREGARREARGRGGTGLKEGVVGVGGWGVIEQGKWEERMREAEEGCKYMGGLGHGISE